MTDDYKCPTCGQPAAKPNWVIAREKGFDGMINAAIKQARGNTQKPDGGLWTYTNDNRQGSGNTPMEALEQWREMI